MHGVLHVVWVCFPQEGGNKYFFLCLWSEGGIHVYNYLFGCLHNVKESHVAAQKIFHRWKLRLVFFHWSFSTLD